MRLRPLARSALVLIPLLLFVGRLHVQGSRNVRNTTQEVNRCLTLVRDAASRRDRKRRAVERFGAAGVETDGSLWRPARRVA